MKVQTLYNNENISLNKKKTKKNQIKKSVSIKSNVKSTSTFSYTDHLGKVISIQDGILVVKHLTKATAGELVEIQTENRTISGMVLNIEKNIRKIVLFGNDSLVLPNDPVYCTGNLVTIPVGPSLLGRVLDSLGNIIDGGKPLDNLDTMNIEVKAPGIMARQPVTEPVYTGILAIDSMIPVGRGQRELIIGDRQTGKTTIAIDMILNQQNFFAKNIKNNFLYCIYVAIGQKRSSLAHIYGKLKKKNALSYTVLLGATASDPASLQYIAPYAGATIGEWFRDHGYHVVIIYDDLSKQAVAYRQISLLLRRPPTREAYPGDVFYIHSRLLERASKLSSNLGGGSLTAFPIIETQAGDVSAFIPTKCVKVNTKS